MAFIPGFQMARIGITYAWESTEGGFKNNKQQQKRRQKIWGTENTKIDSSPCPSVAGQDGAGWWGVYFLLQKVDAFNKKES